MNPEKNVLTVADILRQDYRSADVFNKWGIDYCCQGHLTLGEACRARGVDRPSVEKDLEKATRNIVISNVLQFDSWPVEFLVDYITNVHHAYVKQTLPALELLVAEVVEAHKKEQPGLLAVGEAFGHLKDELLEHTGVEEESIFPYFKQVCHIYKRKETYGSLFVRTLSKPFDEIEHREHRRIAALLAALRQATGHYGFAPDAPANLQVAYQKLRALDADLVQHKHLENNILFPKIRQMEQELLHL